MLCSGLPRKLTQTLGTQSPSLPHAGSPQRVSALTHSASAPLSPPALSHHGLDTGDSLGRGSRHDVRVQGLGLEPVPRSEPCFLTWRVEATASRRCAGLVRAWRAVHVPGPGSAPSATAPFPPLHDGLRGRTPGGDPICGTRQGGRAQAPALQDGVARKKE